MSCNKPPQVQLPHSLELTPQNTIKSSNGVPFHSLSTPGVGVVRLTLVFAGGSSIQSRPFAAASTLSMLSEGSENHTSEQIAQKLDYYGIFYDNSTDRDYCYITIAALSKFLPYALELLEDILLRPLFLEDEFLLYRNKKQEALRINESRPSFVAQRTFANRLFGSSHPYGRVSSVEDYEGLCVEDLRLYYRENLHAGNMFAVSSGDITEDTLALLRTFIERIPVGGGSGVVATFPKPSPILPLRFRIDRPTQTQCCLRFGANTIDKSHSHYIPMQLLMMVLGGYFGSRLMRNLREDKGYTYGVYCAMVNLRYSSYYAIATDVGVEYCDDAIVQIRKEIERLRNQGVDSEELQGAKSVIVGEVMRLMDGPFGIADIAIENIQNGRKWDYINEFLAGIAHTTSEDLQSVAKLYLSSDNMTEIIG